MKTPCLLILLACAALAAFTPPATAAPGDLDLTFGGTGKVITAFAGRPASGASATVQDDGKIVAVGSSNSEFALVRYNANGSLDATFNGSGRVITGFADGNAGGVCVAVQSDGKIVAAGAANIGATLGFALVRYNTNGSLDATFNGTGKVTTAIGAGGQGNSVAIQPDGKIVVAGISGRDIALVRYDANGSLDTGFNGTGKVTTNFAGDTDAGWSLAVQDDGKFVVGGTSGLSFALVRYNSDGTLDTSFNDGGKVKISIGATPEGYSVAIQPNGKIVVAGYCYIGFTSNIALVRCNTDGSLDTGFGSNGKVTTPTGGGARGRSVAIQADGKIVVAGSASNLSTDFALFRYNANGSLDTSFHGTGIVTTDFGGNSDNGSGVVLQSNGKIVVAGYSYDTAAQTTVFAVVRYEGDYPDTDGDGVPDLFETGTGIYVSPTDTGTDASKADSDGDGLNDGEELNSYHTNPNVRDTDGDGFDDGFEVATGFSPTSSTSTPDALSSIRTAAEYRFNAALGISYRIEASTDLANWTTIETPIIGSGGVITRFYSIDGQARRYFRSRRN